LLASVLPSQHRKVSKSSQRERDKLKDVHLSQNSVILPHRYAFLQRYSYFSRTPGIALELENYDIHIQCASPFCSGKNTNHPTAQIWVSLGLRPMLL
jgi:hypothetical protein